MCPARRWPVWNRQWPPSRHPGEPGLRRCRRRCCRRPRRRCPVRSDRGSRRRSSWPSRRAHRGPTRHSCLRCRRSPRRWSCCRPCGCPYSPGQRHQSWTPVRSTAGPTPSGPGDTPPRSWWPSA